LSKCEIFWIKAVEIQNLLHSRHVPTACVCADPCAWFVPRPPFTCRGPSHVCASNINSISFSDSGSDGRFVLSRNIIFIALILAFRSRRFPAQTCMTYYPGSLSIGVLLSRYNPLAKLLTKCYERNHKKSVGVTCWYVKETCGFDPSKLDLVQGFGPTMCWYHHG
jgi:hypothetical protein